MSAATPPRAFVAGDTSDTMLAAPASPGCRGAAGPAVVPVARGWFALAVVSLIVAGLLSLAVVVGRLPVLSAWIADPLFFKRCLVVHVDLALVVWFYAFIGGLLAAGVRQPGGVVGWAGPGLAATGALAMVAGGLVRGAEPVLANYVPVIDHPVFLAGLGLLFAGLAGGMLTLLLRPTVGDIVPEVPMVGLRAAAVAVVLAGATWVSAMAGLPGGLDAWTHYEFSAWGAGHVLQVANTCAMLAVWMWLLERATGRAPLTPRAMRVLMSVLLAPHFLMPLLTVRGTLNHLYHDGATQLMRWGIFPAVLVAVALAAWHLRHREARDPARAALLTGLGASAGLAVLGIVLGACIRGSSTLVPAHYHASLGAVTAALMAAAHVVIGRPPGDLVWRAPRWQLALYGVGQVVFALGFALGGAHGLGRKEYAAEQHVRSAGEYAGLFIMGLGGLVAVAGGVWFLVLVVRGMARWLRGTALYPHSLNNRSA